MRITDFHDDVNQQTLYSLEKLTGVPDFVKNAAVETKEEIGRLPVHVFADPQHRKFPVHTKAATWLAHAYFKQSAPRYSNEERRFIQQRITKAAAFWKIENQLSEFDRQWNRLHVFHAPRDLPDDQYGLIYKTAGYTIRKFPMPNPACVQLAGERLYADRHRYTYPMRKLAARRILRAQKGTGIRFQPETAEYLNKAAGEGGAFPEDVAVKLAQRAIMIKHRHPELAMKLAEVAETIENETCLSSTQLEKLAGLVDSVDQSTGLHRYYYEGVPMPEEFLFHLQEKEAQAYLDAHVELTTGSVYPLAQLKKLPMKKLAQILGSDFTDAISGKDGKVDWTKFAEIAPTLPRDDAKLLEHAIKSAESEASESLPPGALADLTNLIVGEGENIDDEDVHALAESKGIEPDEAEEGLYRELGSLVGGKNDIVEGGKAQGMPTSEFPKDQIEKGIEVEKEHTPSEAVAEEISKDHLTEAKDYYEPRLDKMEKKIESDKEEGKTEGVGEEEGKKKEANFDPAKLTGRSTEKLFKGMGAEVEDADDLTDFKKIIRFKTAR